MEPETKNCQSCKQDFIIEVEDFQFYERIKVPPPTWCQECRKQRRYAWRNERTLYRRPCDLCGKSSVSIYSPDKPYTVYCPPCWWSDKWDASDYARDYDFSRSFFEQFQELQLEVPRIALLTKNSVNSEYINHSSDSKDCYMSVTCFDSENIMYSANAFSGSQDCVDCYWINPGQRLYECNDALKCYQSQFGFMIRDCTNCIYCYDLRGCSDCFFSSNLRNKQYYFLNQPYSKEEYQKKVQEYNLGSFAVRKRLYEQWQNLLKKSAIHKYAAIEKSVESTGNFISNCKNSKNVFIGSDSENVKYSPLFIELKDSMDIYHVGFNCELIYESHALVRSYNVQFSHLSYDDSHLQYCDSCHNSQNLFGCIGIIKKDYCIFNKKYSEEEYKELREKIIVSMKESGEYGEFFPPQLAPFGYNETQGDVYSHMEKEEALARGYKWEDNLPGTFGKETLSSAEIPDDIKDVEDSIAKEVLACAECKRNYNIVAPELAFYRAESIPIPRQCPDCRYKNRINLRPPRKLWSRQCMCDYEVHKNLGTHEHHSEGQCQNKFETSYAPERPEVLYCEQCYQQEVV